MIKITIIIIAGLLTSCDFTTRLVGDYSAYKNFDLTKTTYRIDTLNSGELILTDDGYAVWTKSGDRVTSDDTCYLKYRAYTFWQNDIRK